MSVIDKQPMLEIVDVVHKYGLVTALDHVSLTAAKGEFLTILGESGSGKTTMLRVISGLEQPTSVTTLRIGGEDVRGLPPAHRSCTTVFQSYALFPHMSVEENVAYGLKVRGIAREDRQKEALRVLNLVQLEAKANRRVNQLSGGERQRVALARAVVTKPSILLLDEPLGALDEKLRIEMQEQLVEIQRSLDMTFVYITHSQEEALTMSDRVALMRKGRIEQIGKPLDLFDNPTSRFAAEFMGFENIIPGRIRQVSPTKTQISLLDGTLVDAPSATGAKVQVGDAVFLAIRAERISLIDAASAAKDPRNKLKCIPCEPIYRGKYIDQTVKTNFGDLKLRKWDRSAPSGNTDTLVWRPDDGILLVT